MILVLIIKCNTDTHYIDLLELLWKVVEAIIDTRLRASVRFHEILHRFRTGRGMGTAILELDLAQDISSMYQDLLFMFLINLQNSNNTVDHGHFLETLEGYGSGPCICKED